MLKKGKFGNKYDGIAIASFMKWACVNTVQTGMHRKKDQKMHEPPILSKWCVWALWSQCGDRM